MRTGLHYDVSVDEKPIEIVGWHHRCENWKDSQKPWVKKSGYRGYWICVKARCKATMLKLGGRERAQRIIGLERLVLVERVKEENLECCGEDLLLRKVKLSERAQPPKWPITVRMQHKAEAKEVTTNYLEILLLKFDTLAQTSTTSIVCL